MVITKEKLIKEKALALAPASASASATVREAASATVREAASATVRETASEFASASSSTSAYASDPASATAPSESTSLTLINENDEHLNKNIKARYVFKIFGHILNSEKLTKNSVETQLVESLAKRSLEDRGLQIRPYGTTNITKIGCTFRFQCSGKKCTHFWSFQFCLLSRSAIVTEQKDCDLDCPNLKGESAFDLKCNKCTYQSKSHHGLLVHLGMVHRN